MTNKIADLVHSGQYAQAKQLTTGLMIAYPNDQRLVKANALIDQLMAAPVKAAPTVAPNPADQLSGMDKIDYSALIDLAKQAQETSDLEEQSKLLNQLMDQSKSFLARHPEQMLIWQLRVAAAISLNQPMAGYEAGQKLIASGAADGNDAGVQSLLGQLKNKGWLDLRSAQIAQAANDGAAAYAAKQAEDAKYTLPVIHYFGLGGTAWGHITIYPDKAVYHGTDRTITLEKSSVRKAGAVCSSGTCALFFYTGMLSGESFGVVTEDAVTNTTTKGAIYRKPAVLGNMVVARWGFVASGKDIIPGPNTNAPPTPKPEQHRSSYTSKPTPAPTPTPSPTTPTTPAVAPAGTETTSGAAVLHIYRLHHLTGAGSKLFVEVDGRQVGRLDNGEVMRLELAPGKHNLNATDSRFKSDRPIYGMQMDAGKEYWVRVDLDSGFAVAHVRLYIVTAEDSATEAGTLKSVTVDTAQN